MVRAECVKEQILERKAKRDQFLKLIESRKQEQLRQEAIKNAVPADSYPIGVAIPNHSDNYQQSVLQPTEPIHPV